jgi:hypothetical protein
MLKPISAAALGLSLMGCAQTEARRVMADGQLRVELHPVYADSLRVTAMISHVFMDSLGRGTPAAARNIVTGLFGDTCKDAPIIEEGRIKLAMGREDAVLRVICPAAR